MTRGEPFRIRKSLRPETAVHSSVATTLRIQRDRGEFQEKQTADILQLYSSARPPGSQVLLKNTMAKWEEISQQSLRLTS
jgi:hypothetical protein